jgi:large subunit ribosomal protein L6
VRGGKIYSLTYSNMSRIGKKPIIIPKEVDLKIEGQEVKVKGPKGELSLEVKPEVKLEFEDNKLTLKIEKQNEQVRAYWGLFRALINNAVLGVTNGFTKKLEIQGVGYRAKLEDDKMILELGFSHSIEFEKPENIDFIIEKNIITISGIDKQAVGQTAAEIRDLRPPEPYKGKGIRYLGEEVRKKAGKRAADAS